MNEKRLSVSSIDRRDRALACLTAFDAWAARPSARASSTTSPATGPSAAWAAARTRSSSPPGRAEAWFELSAKAWDLAPILVIAEEAGARFFNFDGGRSIYGGNGVVCVPFLEAELREFVGARGREE